MPYIWRLLCRFLYIRGCLKSIWFKTGNLVTRVTVALVIVAFLVAVVEIVESINGWGPSAIYGSETLDALDQFASAGLH